MKITKYIVLGSMMSLALASCASRLDVENPNYITNDQMAEFMSTNSEIEAQVITGLCGNLKNYIHVTDASTNGGYSNNGQYEANFDMRRQCQAGDMVEGSQQYPGSFDMWYENLASNTYWTTETDANNYGYYMQAVLKFGPAQQALDFLTAEKAEQYPNLRAYRAQALTLKALCYIQLMERYTDLKDVTSTTAQGWPIYNSYSYNSPLKPLSVAETWSEINAMLKEAADLFKNGTYGDKGYTMDRTVEFFGDIDLGVCQYYRCRAGLDSQNWDTVIEAGNDLIAHFPDFIAASDYGMNQSKLASVNSRSGIDAEHPNGTGWDGEDFNASQNAFFAIDKNPEGIFGGLSGTNLFWSIAGLNALKNGPSGYYQMDKNIYDQLSDSDCRKACILAENFDDFHVYSVNGGDTTWYSYTMPKYTSLKFAASSGTVASSVVGNEHSNQYTTSDNVYLRSSVAYLAVAEAYANKGDGSNAKATLNKLLAARTLPGKTLMTCDNTMSGKSALDMVKLQWRAEMWGEGDWAFFNQKRWGTTFQRGSNHWSTTGVPSQGWTWEIPRQERQGNPYWN